MRRELLYVEAKAGDLHRGTAWIAMVKTSKTGRTVYFDGRALGRHGSGGRGNHVCLRTRDEYWVSRPKRDGGDRHVHGGGAILVERRALEPYLAHRGLTADDLRPSEYRVIDDLPDPDLDALHAEANDPL